MPGRWSRWPLVWLAALAVVLNLVVLVGSWTGGTVPDHRATMIIEFVLPRMATGLLVGAALGLAAALFQHVLRNPLAEPTTLGISAGAYLALTAATLWAPWLLEPGREWMALLGAALAAMAVFVLAGQAASPVTMIVAGLLVSLLCGALAALFVLLNHDYLTEVFIWQSGSLAQIGWTIPVRFVLTLGVASVIAAVMLRPLALLELGDEGSRALGMPVGAMRWAALCLATVLSAVVVASVGVLGFVGLGAPALARIIGVRHLAHRLIVASLVGALLLTIADAFVMLLPTAQQVPVGVATAALGAPLILLLQRRLRPSPIAGHQAPGGERDRAPRGIGMLVIAVPALLAIGLLALLLGRGGEAWHGLQLDGLSSVLVDLRLPRALAAAAAGGMLALAGVLLQRWTANPLASPEVLGVSSGACLGVVLAMLLIPGFDATLTWIAAWTGAGLALACFVWMGRSTDFAPDQVLVGGAAMSVLATAITAILMTKGDPRIGFLLTWLTGSTYRTTLAQAEIAIVIALGLLAVTPFLLRWLAILPLGEPVGRMLGVPLLAAQCSVLLVAAIATASATLIVGPLSFVGLLAPQLTRQLGFRRPEEHLVASFLIGAAIMLLADWLGRTLIYPWQIPSGLVATLIGGLAFALMLRQTRGGRSTRASTRRAPSRWSVRAGLSTRDVE
ncbi:MAG: Fe(3+)-hydroxamate ABC transporter permease FhuB [Chelatococcus sp.]|uniref:Fe(3+)-hydroxamate ABC transporter permease FhuB n=1 Tax=Chelatococcus sp. TaxID=1953771 RepID=UPI0025C6625D|nr:Fe(3+)-hydroxamate ABC transporter permease FhuB [Chelatococcus sp.]MBX3536674.1 Fe(3+)-hydroxamate ABC transporter permease FhuB [Chelatococcus sp.]